MLPHCNVSSSLRMMMASPSSATTTTHLWWWRWTARTFSSTLRRSSLFPSHSTTSTAASSRCSSTSTTATATATPSPHHLSPSQPPPPPLTLYNTMSKAKERFSPRPDQGNNVSMYVCGVTVYDYSHIGHARVYVAFDILYRYLLALHYDVTYVRNFTDIDDKIINRAAASGEDPLALSRRFIEEFHADVDTLGCLRPTQEPKATEYIGAMIASIQKIIDNGHGYVVGDGDVFFQVDTLPSYGALSGRSQEDNRAGERVAVDSRKRGPADFALWKAAKPGEPSWPSPWGAGRPGWHIECSAMIGDVLGHTVDIHGGGRDLVFPHHENELAQATACQCGGGHSRSDSKQPFVRYWVHNGFVNVDAEKMSKSLGNFFTIRDVLRQYHPMALRWFLVSTQYRQGINYTQRALEEASDRIYYLYQTIADVQDQLAANVPAASAAPAGGKNTNDVGGALLEEALTALADDLNTPLAIAALSAPLKAINDLLHTKKGRKQPNRGELLQSYVKGLHGVLGMLGLWPEDAKKALEELKSLALVRAGLTEQQVVDAIEERAKARAAKDFEAADAVRKRLEEKGVMIMDFGPGTSSGAGSGSGSGWKPKISVE